MEIINFSEYIYLSYPIQHNLNSYFIKYVEEQDFDISIEEINEIDSE